MLKFSRRSVLLMPMAFAACRGGPSVVKLSGGTMGTVYNVVALDESRSLSEGEVRAAVDGALAEVDVQMSNWNPVSEISRFNDMGDATPVALSPALRQVMEASEQVYIASEGRFDTTMGPLIELWGFGAPGVSAQPDDAEIADALGRAGHGRSLTLGGGTLAKQQAGAQVYLAAIGKGYGADHVGRALEALGIENYMVEIGGDIYAAGHNPDGMPWQIGIETPVASGGIHSVVGLSDHGLASSGDYRNFFERDGKRYSHVIDPVTGRPIAHKTTSATVMAENSMLADAWSTAMLILGRERGLEIAEEHDVAVLFMDRASGGFDTFTSSRLDALTA